MNFTNIIINAILIFLLFIPNICIAQTIGPSYCGPYNSSQPVLINSKNDTTISLLKISNPSGHCLKITNCNNIIIEKCMLGPSIGNGIDLYNCTNVEIRDCRIDSVASGVFALASKIINIHNIEVKNVQGPFPRGQMVQFDKVDSIGNRVNYNVAENILGESYPEDAISMYKSNGTSIDPIQIKGNWIRGGGPSSSGGGIMAGDNGGSYMEIEDNILVNPGQYGIAISSGTEIEIRNNKIYSKQQSFSNVGIYVWNQYASPCNNNTVSGNDVNWTNNLGVINNNWDGGGCGTIIDWNNNNWGANIDSNILPQQILLNCLSVQIEKSNVFKESLKLYPNPSNGNLTIEFKLMEKKNGMFILYDISGKKMMDQVINRALSVINLENLLPGIYFYEVMNANKTHKGKLIKQE